MAFSGSAFIGTNLGSGLQAILQTDDIQPGSLPSYQTCKDIYDLHPLGARLAESPVSLAFSQKREIKIPNSPGEMVIDAFKAVWADMGCDNLIHSTMTVSRIYGIGSLAMLVADKKSMEQIDVWDLADLEIGFNVLDPLNTSGSLVLNQNPNAIDFMKATGNITAAGVPYARSRTVTILHENPIYLSWTPSAYGFVGRSVYQRGLYPLKSYLQSMIADNLVATKVGVIIAKTKQGSSIIDNIVAVASAFKRNIIKEASTGNVINITPDEDIESLNLQNLEGPHVTARRNIMENLASACDMPVKLVTQEPYAEGFGEGTEDAKQVARFIDKLRATADPLFTFLDRICMYRAWTPAFFKSVQVAHPDIYAGMTYKEAFYRWANSFVAVWPSFLREPDSMQIKVDDVKFKAAIALYQIFEPLMDPFNKVELVKWLCDAVSSNKLLFAAPIEMDFKKLLAQANKIEGYADEAAEANIQEYKQAEAKPAKIKLARADSVPTMTSAQVIELITNAAKK